jgi:carboxypeptidase C (cathepsin A)
MRVSFRFSAVFVALVSHVSWSAARRLSSSSDGSCNNAKDEKSCFQQSDPATGASCVWCSCAAIPSECLTQDQSQQVPPGVFDCKTPSWTEPLESTMASGAGTVLERMTWTEQSVDDAFCDSRSSSGYVSIDESTFDQDGENKHLFYWMFEKRDSDVTDTTIPLIIWLTGGPGCSSSL